MISLSSSGKTSSARGKLAFDEEQRREQAECVPFRSDRRRSDRDRRASRLCTTAHVCGLSAEGRDHSEPIAENLLQSAQQACRSAHELNYRPRYNVRDEDASVEHRVLRRRDRPSQSARRVEEQSLARLNAVVTMFDSGGSSGQLRDELGVLPPGDVLKCALALARNEAEARRVLLARVPSIDPTRLRRAAGTPAATCCCR